MALAENVLRRIHKMGLIPKAVKHLPRLTVLLALFSVVWLVTLPMDGNYRNCYISENALMPGQVHSYFRESEWNIVRGYREEVSKLEQESIKDKNRAVSSWLEDMGLQISHYHNGASDTDEIIYAIMHAPRGENTEAMALVVPWYNADAEYNEGGMALGMALMRYFLRISVWSKNIILVIPPDGKKSLRNWVEAYHTSLDDTAGSIEAAVVVDYGKQGDYFEYYDMYYEGLNGQLPNLDLLNTANTIGGHENIGCSIQGINGRVTDFQNKLKTLFWGIARLVTAGAIDVHGHEAFSGWQIQAFTIKARGDKGHDVTQFGRIVDSTFRSVNNLLEKFHQSFFFYLLLSPKHFVSIGTYLPAAVMLAVSFALGTLNSILNTHIEVDAIKYGVSKLLTIVVVVESFCVGLALLAPYESTSLIQISQLLVLVVGGFIFMQKVNMKRVDSYSLISFALLSIALLIVALLIVHFALAFTVGILALPLTFIPTLFQRKKNPRLAVLFVLVITNPFLIIHAGGLLTGHENFLQNLIMAWVDLQSWTWIIIALAWFPAWLFVFFASVLLIAQSPKAIAINPPSTFATKLEKSE